MVANKGKQEKEFDYKSEMKNILKNNRASDVC